MFDLFREILTSPFGSFASVFSVLSLLFFLAYKSGKIVAKYKVVDKILENIDKMKEDISEIKGFITFFRNNNNQFGQTQSPISLTEKGKETSKDLHIERIIKNNWFDVSKDINSRLKNSHNLYDIQEVCFEIGRGYSKKISENDFNEIKDYAFQKGYNLYDFDLLFGIIIRDLYFKEQEINIKEIDKHTPPKN